MASDLNLTEEERALIEERRDAELKLAGDAGADMTDDERRHALSAGVQAFADDHPGAFDDLMVAEEAGPPHPQGEGEHLNPDGNPA